MNDSDVNLLKEVEKSRKREKSFEERKRKNEEFEEASQSAYFTVFNSIIGAITAVISVVIVELFLWKTSKILFSVVTGLLFVSMFFRMLSKHYYMKGQQKKFETFNKLSKVTGVASSVVDATVLKGTKAIASSSKAGLAQEKMNGAIETVAEMQFNGGVYVDSKYNYVRVRCKRMGDYIRTTQDSSYIENLYTEIYKELTEAKMTKTSNTVAKIFVLYTKDKLNGTYSDEYDDLYSSIIGALYFYREPFNELPNSVPLVGYKDNVFASFCVYAGNRELIDEYTDWKLKRMRTKVVTNSLKGSEAIWNMLVSKGATVTNIDTILQKYSEKLNETNLDISNRNTAKTLLDMMYHYNQLEFDIDKMYVAGVLGCMLYIISGKISAEGLADIEGYLDMDVLVKCCEIKCSEVLQTFRNWKLAYDMFRDNDALHQYLDTYIGDDNDLRLREVRRLSKLCNNTELKGDYRRARYTIEKKFNIKSQCVIPDDMHEWAISRDISDKEAIELIYSYIPEIFRNDDIDDRELTIRYWYKYKKILMS